MALTLTSGMKLVLATHNEGKVRELGALLAPHGLNVVSAAHLGLDEPEETGTTFAGNALIKARSAAKASGLIALADDSGLVVEALNGAPGIYSARWAGESKDFSLAMQRVADELAAKGAHRPEERRAHFHCSLALVSPDGCESVIDGQVKGTIVWPPRGNQGFGYDPIFLPDGNVRTFGEMNAEEKHGSQLGEDGLSHRARAFSAWRRAYLI